VTEQATLDRLQVMVAQLRAASEKVQQATLHEIESAANAFFRTNQNVLFECEKLLGKS